MPTFRRASSFATMGLLLAVLVPATAMPAAAATTYHLALDPVTSGLQSLTQVTNANDGTNRLFVVEQRGDIRVVQGGVVQPGFFLDIRSWVANSGEQGLLGVAFHPDFATNHRFFVYYTRNGGDIVVMRFTASAPGTETDTSTAAALIGASTRRPPTQPLRNSSGAARTTQGSSAAVNNSRTVWITGCPDATWRRYDDGTPLPSPDGRRAARRDFEVMPR